MTALWFGHLGGADKVAVKPHASPVYHAIKYLTGELDRSYLTRLRQLGGLQAYPTPHQGPRRVRLLDRVGRPRRRRPAVRRRHPPLRRRPLRHGRPAGPRSSPSSVTPSSTRATCGRRSPTRRCRGSATSCWSSTSTARASTASSPTRRSRSCMEFFDGAGWHVVEAKYGSLLTAAFDRPGGDALRAAHRRDVERGVPVAVRPPRRGAARPLPRRRRRRGPRLRRRHRPTTSWRRSSRTSAATTSACCWRRLPGLRRGDRSPERRVRLHGQGLGPADRRRPAEPLGPAVGPADRRAARVARPDAGDRVGPLRPDVGGRAGVRGRPVASSTTSPVPPRPVLPIPDATNVPAVGSRRRRRRRSAAS